MSSRILLITILTILSITSSASARTDITLLNNTENDFSILNRNTENCSFKNTLSSLSLSTVKLNNRLYTEISIQGYVSEKASLGKPDLPVFSTLIEIPHNVSTSISINTAETQTINLSDRGFNTPLKPVQPSISKNSDNNPVFYFHQPSYQSESFIANDYVKLQILGEFRDKRIARLILYPFRYNPAKNMINVCTELTFNINYSPGRSTRQNVSAARYKSSAFQAFDSAIESGTPLSITKAVPSNQAGPLTLVIVSPREFESTLLPFIQWKQKSGYNVIQGYTDTIGTTTSAIKTYLENLYNNTTPAPSYVLFVGDTNHIPSFYKYQNVDNTHHYTDLDYCEYTGDSLPDVLYGRMSADSATDLQHIIEKTLRYEQYTFTDSEDDYLGNALMIAGVDPSFATSYGNGQIWYAINEYVNTSNELDEIFAYLYNYDNSWDWNGSVNAQDSNTSSASDSIVDRINTGVGFANYTAHCNMYGWDDPAILTSMINSELDRNNSYGFYIGNCCQSARFSENDAFGEEIVAAEEKGAVAYIGAANDTFWDEDFYWAVGNTSNDIMVTDPRDHTFSNSGAGLYDGLWHSHGEPSEDWYITAAQILFSGNLAVSESLSDYDERYWEMYNLLGDPTLMPYLKKPSALPSPTHSGDIKACSDTTYTVTTESYSYVALSQNGNLLDARYTGSGTSVTLEFEPLGTSLALDLVITRQNTIPYTETITVSGAPEEVISAAFSATSEDAGFVNIQSGNRVAFINRSTGCPDTFQWTVTSEDSTIFSQSTDPEPEIIFPSMGTYSVSLTVSKGIDSDTLQVADYINVTPVVDFSVSDNRFPLGTTVSFTDDSTDSPVNHQWNFEGGVPPASTEQNPSVTYPETGTYNVTLTTTIGGSTYTEEKQDYITVTQHPPVADFTADATTIKAGESIQFTNLSTNNPVFSSWSFESGSPSSSAEPNPSVKYDYGGNFRVTLVVTNDGGYDSKTVAGYISVDGPEKPPTPVIPAGSSSSGGCFIQTAE